MKLNFKIKILLGLILILLSSRFLIAQELSEGPSSVATEKVEAGTRIVISTSGPVRFNSYWLDNPPRLVVEFQSRNVLSKIDNEVVVNEGVIKKITSTYFGRGQGRSLKALTFELIERVPYKIYQEGNAILLDIQAPLETSGFSIGAKGKEVFVEGKASNIIKRLEAMDTAVIQVAKNQLSLENTETKVTNKSSGEIGKGGEPIVRVVKNEAEAKRIIPATSVKVKEVKKDIILWLAGLVSILILGLLIRRRYNVNKSKNNNMVKKMKVLTSQLQEKNKRLEQEEIIRKTVEKTALEKEKEYERLQLELQEKNKVKEELSQKEKELEQLSDSYESLKDIVVKKGLAKKALSREGKESLWIPGQSEERRQWPRLALTRDYNRTLILRIDSSIKSESIKSFANNISFDGLCFESKKEFQENESLNLRLFFYGDNVPILKIQGRIVWRKTTESMNYYGVSFDWLEEKDKLELSRHIESKIGGS